jgi:hypothetical protein
MDKVGDLSDEELLARVREHVGKGHVWQARLIAYLAEVEDRRLHLVHACSSMWDFCTRKLGMSEGEAHRRITAARIVRRFPHVLGYLERGEIHLCALYALRGHLTGENVDELVREASGKSTREVEAMMAARFPKPDVPSRVEPVAPQVLLRVAPQAPLPVASSNAQAAWSTSLAASPASKPRPRVEPLSATRFRVEVTVSADTKATLERIQDLMRHRNPTGDLETILDASLALLLAKLEKERLGKTSRPRKGKTVDTKTSSSPTESASAGTNAAGPDAAVHAEASAHVEVSTHAEAITPESDKPAHDDPHTEDGSGLAFSRKTARPGTISRAVRREVFARDGEQCTFTDAAGHRCPARGYVELDHIHPRALGGSDRAENLRVRCRAHNALYAEEVFGRGLVEERMHLQRNKCSRIASEREGTRNASTCGTSRARSPVERKSAPARLPAPASETAARALCSLGFREPEVRKALVLLETKLDIQAAGIDTILREALLILT